MVDGQTWLGRVHWVAARGVDLGEMDASVEDVLHRVWVGLETHLLSERWASAGEEGGRGIA
jgi:hypothetical protein